MASDASPSTFPSRPFRRKPFTPKQARLIQSSSRVSSSSTSRLTPLLRFFSTFGGAIAVFLVGTFAFVAEQRAADDRAQVAHSHDVIERTHAALSSLQDAETGQRGFLLTGDSAYLSPYRDALERINADTLGLRQLLAGNGLQEQRLDTLDRLVSAKLDELERTVALRASSGLAAANKVVRSGTGKAIMDSIRAEIAVMQREERGLLAQRQEQSDRSARILLIALTLGTGIAVIAALLANGLMARYAALQEDHATQLSNQNDRLREQAVELELQREQLHEQAIELEGANEQLQVKMVAARAASEAKSEFLASVSHELRTPLNAIDGYSDLMLMGVRGPLTTEQTEDLGRIRKSSRHLLTLINQVLNLTKIEARDVDLDLRDHSVASLIADVEVLIQPQIAAKGLRYELGPLDPHLNVFADGVKVRQIIINLLTNAIKFTDRGGSITVSAEPSSNGAAPMALIRVADTGRGIPPDKLVEIFEPFTQVDRRLTPDHERGIGLGLSISRNLARAMRGDLTAESVAGKGSTFTLSLPTTTAQ